MRLRAAIPGIAAIAALTWNVCAVESEGVEPVNNPRSKQFDSTWESLNSRSCPKWFPEAKLGIFIHWGVTSVPAYNAKGFYAEWYWNHWKNDIADGAVRKFHEKNYGKNFSYQEFAPMFKAELFDPNEWAQLFKDSGARYVCLVSKHHDGFCLWPAPDSWNWNSVDLGPKRDLCGDLAEAVRAKGLRMAFYYSLPEWYNPLYENDINKYVDQHMLPQLKDLVTRYQPAMIFGDGEWYHKWQTWRSNEFLAWLYNEGPNPDEVVVNDRWGPGYGKCGDYYTTEYHRGASIDEESSHPWVETRGIGKSFGYNRNENIHDYMDRTECVRMLIDAASRGGGLLLNVGPTSDGRIPVIQQDRLLAIGKWLEVNGEAIYATTRGPYGALLPWGRSTVKGDTLYLHVYDWPEDNALGIPGLRNEVLEARLLADKKGPPLSAKRLNGGDLQIDLLGRHPSPHTTVIALKLDGPPNVDKNVLAELEEQQKKKDEKKPAETSHDKGAEE
ncbi:MAG TPA: alpha-L-fucosidase [Sumerlaeia bacterium]|nr:alpha-L-fucosidase [Sumerlaeia bacterium]